MEADPNLGQTDTVIYRQALSLRETCNVTTCYTFTHLSPLDIENVYTGGDSSHPEHDKTKMSK